jgi:hypothetical protein
MERFSVDYGKLVQKVDQPKAYRLNDVKDRIERVAFDVVRFRDNEDTDMLWKIEERADGPVIVALYDDSTGALKSKSNSENKWETLADKTAGNIHVYYKGEPIAKFAASDMGIPREDLGLLVKWLPNKLAEDSELVGFVMSKSGEGKGMIIKRHPELNIPESRLSRLAARINMAGE